MNDLYLNFKKHLYEFLSAIGFIFIFYFKNKFIHDYFGYSGFFQSYRYKILKIEKLAQLISLANADRAILFELEDGSYYPTAYSLREGISFQSIEKLSLKDFEESNKLEDVKISNLFNSKLYPSKHIHVSYLEDSNTKIHSILVLHYVLRKSKRVRIALIQEYNQKLKEILKMEKKETKKFIGVFILFLTRMTKLITIKNILRIILMIVNVKIIFTEMSKESHQMVMLNFYDSPTEIPISFLFLLIGITNTGMLEGLLLVLSKIGKDKLKETGNEK